MINDSDEDVIYGSDEESRKPLTASSSKNAPQPSATTAAAAARPLVGLGRSANESYDSD